MLTDGSSAPGNSEQARAALIVLGALEEYNRRVELALRLSLEPASTLYGPGGGLDSLGLLDFVTLLEAKLEQELRRPVAVVEEAAECAAFRTVESLIATVRALLDTRRP